MRYLKYFLLQLKRTAKQATGVFPAAMLLFACIFAAAMLLLSASDPEHEGERYRIGIVGDVNDNYLGFGFTAIQTLDSSRYTVDFVTMSEDEAYDAFRSGDIIALIKIPEGFTQAVSHGRNNVPVSYVSSRGLKGIEGYIMDEFADVVSRLVTSAQTAFFAVNDVAEAVGSTDGLDVYMKEFNLKVIDYILNRGKLVETKEIGLSDGLGLTGYYTCAVLLLFVFLLGTGSAYFFSGRNGSLGRWMRLKRIGSVGQIACEYGAYLILMLLCMIIPIVIAGCFFDVSALGLDITVGSVVVRLIPVLVMVSAMNFFLYEAVSGTISCVLIQFIAVIAMSYISGYIYPAGFFPKAMAAVGRVLPTGAALSFMTAGVTHGDGGSGSFLMIAGYTAAFLAGAVMLRRRASIKETVTATA